MDLLIDHIFGRSKERALTQMEVGELCHDIEALAQGQAGAKAMMSAALAVVRAAPKDYRPQLLAAQLMERARQKTDMLDTWTGLHDRFPDLHIALRFMVRWLNRDGQISEATELLCTIIDTDEGKTDPVDLAELCSEIKDVDQASILFDRLLSRDPSNNRVRVIYGKSLFARGEVYRAFAVLDPISEERLSPTARDIVHRSQTAHAAMTALGDGETSVLTKALEIFASRSPRALNPDYLGGISFYTGSLGAGGAERQLTQMASAFHQRRRAGRNIHGTRLGGTVEVIVNNIDENRGKNFFAPALKASGVPLSVTANMPCEDLDTIATENAHLSHVIPLLPRNVRYGLERLTKHFRETAPDVAYFWQDGAVLTGALAALVAQVPRIAISLRGLPPNRRPHMMKPEYPDLYRALAKVPGVSFSCNSRTAADAYADWLDLPRNRFSVIYNAVRSLPKDGEKADHRLWSLFDQTTRDATFTMGGIFRFDPNKRSLLWLDYAKKIAQTHPNARFVIVGDGAQLAQAQAKAAEIGLEPRILFVGSSQNPGFWLSKMDALCLLSETEGLPNVLIEAQMAGLPVISTPAGGAAETFEDGTTGFLLSSATNPSVHEFEIYANSLITDVALRRDMGDKGRTLAIQKFERETVFAQTIRFFHGQHVAGDKEHTYDAKVTQLTPKKTQSAFDLRAQAAYNVVAKL